MQQVFIHHDTNALDVTIAPLKQPAPTTDASDTHMTATEAVVANHAPRPPPSALGMPETLHTTTEHQFLTADRGFVAAQTLRVGEQVVRGDGSLGVVTAVRVTPEEAVR